MKPNDGIQCTAILGGTSAVGDWISVVGRHVPLSRELQNLDTQYLLGTKGTW